jgi:hypothetical protein
MVTVSPPPARPAPTLTFTANPTTVAPQGTWTLMERD